MPSTSGGQSDGTRTGLPNGGLRRDWTEREQVALDALSVLAGAETVLKRLLAGLSMGTPSFERATYLIKTRIKEHSKIVDKVFARRAERPAYEAKDVTDIIGLRILALYRSDLPSLLQRFLKFVNSARSEPLDLFPGNSVKDVVEEVIVYGYPLDQALCQAIVSQLKQYALVIGDNRVRYEARDNGYSSIHLVLRAQASAGDSVLKIPVEVQIRTVLEDAWGEVQHELMYKSRMGDPTAAAPALLNNAQDHLRNWKKLLDTCGDTADAIKELIREIFSPADIGRAFPSIDDQELTKLRLPARTQRRINDAVAKIELLFRRLESDDVAVSVDGAINELADIAVIMQECLGTVGNSHVRARYMLAMEVALCLMWIGRMLRSGSSTRVDGEPLGLSAIRDRLRNSGVVASSRADAQDLTFAATTLDEAASRYFALEQDHPNDPMIAYRLGEVFSARGEPELALAKFEDAVRLLEGATQIGLEHRLRVQMPRRLGYAYWEAGETIRTKAQKLSNPEFALNKRRDYYQRAILVTKAAFDASNVIRRKSVGREESARDRELTANNLLDYCLEYLKAKGSIESLADVGLNSEILRALLADLLGDGDSGSIKTPAVADTVREAARYFGDQELERRAARQVLDLLDKRDWRHRYPVDIIESMQDDAKRTLPPPA